MTARGVAWVVAVFVTMGPSIAGACAVCTAGRDEENQMAFLISTIGMSLLPLVALGTLVFVLWRRLRKLEAATAETRAAQGETGLPVAGASRRP